MFARNWLLDVFSSVNTSLISTSSRYVHRILYLPLTLRHVFGRKDTHRILFLQFTFWRVFKHKKTNVSRLYQENVIDCILCSRRKHYCFYSRKHVKRSMACRECDSHFSWYLQKKLLLAFTPWKPLKANAEKRIRWHQKMFIVFFADHWILRRVFRLRAELFFAYTKKMLIVFFAQRPHFCFYSWKQVKK